MNALQALRRSVALLALPLLLAFAAPHAQAQAISIGFGKHGHHGSINLSAGFVFGAPARPAPIYVAPVRCAPQPVWIPGHYQDVERRVFVPGCTRQVYVPAVYEDRYWRDYCGQLHLERVLTCAAYWRTVQDQGRWEFITERIWIDGGWTKVAS